MPARKKRPIYTRVGKIKPLGKSRVVKKAKPRPWRPFKITSYRLKERLPRVEGLVIHRRPSGRPDIALDPRELRAVPLSKVRGTLPERIFYKQLRKRRLSPDREFDFQSSLLGGRLQLGGIVADFLFPLWRLIVRIQGPTHTTRVQSLKDQQQVQLLVDMGWTVYDLPVEIVYDMMALETWMRRHIDRHPSLGGQQVVGQTVFLATGQMNFAWTAQEYTRVAVLEDAVENLIRDMGRIEGKAVVTINGLSDINTNLGLVQAGEFRVGNKKYPGSGFTGVRIGWPAFVYGGEEWHIAGVNNDVLQFGLRATDGAALFGAGNCILTADGMQIRNVGSSFDDFPWYGIEFVNDVADPYKGFLAFLDDATAHLVIGIYNTSADEKHYLTLSTKNLDTAAYWEWMSFDHGLARLEYSDTTKDVQFSLIGGVNGEAILVLSSPDDIARAHISGKDASYLDIDGHSVAPGTPASPKGRIFNHNDRLFFKNDSGFSHSLSPYYAIFDTAQWSNSTAWHDYATLTIPAGTMDTGTGFWMDTLGYYIANGSNTLYWRVDVNGTQYPNAAGVPDSVTASATRRPLIIPLSFHSGGSTSVQELYMAYDLAGTAITQALAINSLITTITVKIQVRMSVASAGFIVARRSQRVFMHADT